MIASWRSQARIRTVRWRRRFRRSRRHPLHCSGATLNTATSATIRKNTLRHTTEQRTAARMTHAARAAQRVRQIFPLRKFRHLLPSPQQRFFLRHGTGARVTARAPNWRQSFRLAQFRRLSHHRRKTGATPPPAPAPHSAARSRRRRSIRSQAHEIARYSINIVDKYLCLLIKSHVYHLPRGARPHPTNTSHGST